MVFVLVQFFWFYLLNNINDLVGDKCIVVVYGEKCGICGVYFDLQLFGFNGEVMFDVEGFWCISYFSVVKIIEDRIFSSFFIWLVWRFDICILCNGCVCEMYFFLRDNVKKVLLWGIINKLVYFVVYSMYMMYGMFFEDDMFKFLGDVGYFFDWIK